MDKEELIYSISRKMNDLISFMQMKYSSSQILYVVQKLNQLFMDIPEMLQSFLGLVDGAENIEWECNWSRIQMTWQDSCHPLGWLVNY